MCSHKLHVLLACGAIDLIWSPFKERLSESGFIKSTDQFTQRPTEHRPLTHRPLIRRPNNHRPNDKFMFKRLENMKTFILQNASTTGKIKKDTLVYYLSE